MARNILSQHEISKRLARFGFRPVEYDPQTLEFHLTRQRPDQLWEGLALHASTSRAAKQANRRGDYISVSAVVSIVSRLTVEGLGLQVTDHLLEADLGSSRRKQDFLAWLGDEGAIAVTRFADQSNARLQALRSTLQPAAAGYAARLSPTMSPDQMVDSLIARISREQRQWAERLAEHALLRASRLQPLLYRVASLLLAEAAAEVEPNLDLGVGRDYAAGDDAIDLCRRVEVLAELLGARAPEGAEW